MAAAAVVEFQRAQSLISTDRDASIDILHAIGKCTVHNESIIPCRLVAVFIRPLVWHPTVTKQFSFTHGIS